MRRLHRTTVLAASMALIAAAVAACGPETDDRRGRHPGSDRRRGNGERTARTAHQQHRRSDVAGRAPRAGAGDERRAHRRLAARCRLVGRPGWNLVRRHLAADRSACARDPLRAGGCGGQRRRPWRATVLAVPYRRARGHRPARGEPAGRQRGRRRPSGGRVLRPPGHRQELRSRRGSTSGPADRSPEPGAGSTTRPSRGDRVSSGRGRLTSACASTSPAPSCGRGCG